MKESDMVKKLSQSSNISQSTSYQNNDLNLVIDSNKYLVKMKGNNKSNLTSLFR
jgi:hypothetical protein